MFHYKISWRNLSARTLAAFKNAQLGNGQTAASGISAVQNALECFEYHFHKRQLIRANYRSEVQSSSDVRSSDYGGA